MCFASRRDFCFCSCRSIADIAGSEEGDLLAKEIMEVTSFCFSKAPLLAFLEALLGRSRQCVGPSLMGRWERWCLWVAEMPAFLPASPLLRRETYLSAAGIFLSLGRKHSNEGPVD